MLGFELKCRSCGNTIEINKGNAGTFIHLFGYRKVISPTDAKDKILVYDVEDGENQGIICNCGNWVTG